MSLSRSASLLSKSASLRSKSTSQRSKSASLRSKSTSLRAQTQKQHIETKDIDITGDDRYRLLNYINSMNTFTLYDFIIITLFIATKTKDKSSIVNNTIINNILKNGKNFFFLQPTQNHQRTLSNYRNRLEYTNESIDSLLSIIYDFIKVDLNPKQDYKSFIEKYKTKIVLQYDNKNLNDINVNIQYDNKINLNDINLNIPDERYSKYTFFNRYSKYTFFDRIKNTQRSINHLLLLNKTDIFDLDNNINKFIANIKSYFNDDGSIRI
jgi:hypothetical protein